MERGTERRRAAGGNGRAGAKCGHLCDVVELGLTGCMLQGGEPNRPTMTSSCNHQSASGK